MTTETNPPTTFKDSSGREWKPSLNFVTLRTIRDKCQVDLGDIEHLATTWAELLTNDLKALDTLWLSIEHSANGVTKDDWLALMDGERVESAMDALQEALRNFTRPLKRGMVTEAIATVMTGYRKAVEQAETAIKEAGEEVTTRGLEQLGIAQPSAQG